MKVVFAILVSFIVGNFAHAGGSVWTCYGFNPRKPSVRASTIMWFGAAFAGEPLSNFGGAGLMVLDNNDVDERVQIVENPKNHTYVEGKYYGNVYPRQISDSGHTEFAGFNLYKDGKYLSTLSCVQR